MLVAVSKLSDQDGRSRESNRGLGLKLHTPAVAAIEPFERPPTPTPSLVPPYGNGLAKIVAARIRIVEVMLKRRDKVGGGIEKLGATDGYEQ